MKIIISQQKTKGLSHSMKLLRDTLNSDVIIIIIIIIK